MQCQKPAPTVKFENSGYRLGLPTLDVSSYKINGPSIARSASLVARADSQQFRGHLFWLRHSDRIRIRFVRHPPARDHSSAESQPPTPVVSGVIKGDYQIFGGSGSGTSFNSHSG
jgi:hypothetical protein